MLSVINDRHRKHSIVNSISLQGALGISESERSPIDAPDSDFFQWLDYSNDSRNTIVANNFTEVWIEKLGKAGRANSYYAAASAQPPSSLQTMNLLRCADFDGGGTLNNSLILTVPADLEFMYPSMTFFAILQPKISTTQTGFIISDYGNLMNKLVYLKIGNGAALEVSVYMRDAGGNIITAGSGANLLSLDTNYLIVAKMDGVNRTVTFWINGAGLSFTATNPLYDNTTTWEGRYVGAAVPTVGVLSGVSNPFYGYVGEIFLTKTILSNSDINSYANWFGAKWGIGWNNI
jgi:hypothetical protein